LKKKEPPLACPEGVFTYKIKEIREMIFKEHLYYFSSYILKKNGLLEGLTEDIDTGLIQINETVG
jgi:hypothetical protein